jgi:hypothetical protein
MKIKPFAVLAAVAALGVPATALAAKPADKPVHPAKAHGKAHAPKVKNAVFKGSVVSVDGTTVTVHVDKANHWGRSFKGQDVAFDVSKLKKAPVVVAGDAVLVQAKIANDATPPLTARKLNKLSGDDGADDDAPEAAPTAGSDS